MLWGSASGPQNALANASCFRASPLPETDARFYFAVEVPAEPDPVNAVFTYNARALSGASSPR
jgi:hypothetical protein